ncbi:MAG TPA: hypothetical protein VK797_22860 [Tepidisphaeraceae bacterium]|jgi:hypothetical protein|nr:hypothetical protein [Tepidisphaeraceae bacterium]
MISLIFPHHDSPENNACLELKRQMLADNTCCPYQLLYVVGTTPDDVYPAWNWLAKRAKYDILLWDNSDIVYAPGWDENIRRHINDADWLCLRLVECGAIGVAGSNIGANFGRTATSFDRPGFEHFCAVDNAGRSSIELDIFGWYSPSAFRKSWFLEKGGLPDKIPFPHDNDADFKVKVFNEGCRFARIGSYAYHFQRQWENLGRKVERELPPPPDVALPEGFEPLRPEAGGGGEGASGRVGEKQS